MNRFAPSQIVLIGATLAASWLSMQQVHEAGHVSGAWLTGGRVARVVLHPLEISRTDLVANPQPLLVVWAGPICGVLLPLVIWGGLAFFRMKQAFLARFFAGFCLIANGAYIAGGATAEIGDCGEMLRHGAPLWTLWLFGAATIPAGLYLWNGLGPAFGLGPQALSYERCGLPAAVAWLLLSLALAITIECLNSHATNHQI